MWQARHSLQERRIVGCPSIVIASGFSKVCNIGLQESSLANEAGLQPHFRVFSCREEVRMFSRGIACSKI